MNVFAFRIGRRKSRQEAHCILYCCCVFVCGSVFSHWWEVMIAVAHTLKTEKIAREKAKPTHLGWVRAVFVVDIV